MVQSLYFVRLVQNNPLGERGVGWGGGGGGLSHLWLSINFSGFLVFHSKLISHLQIF